MEDFKNQRQVENSFEGPMHYDARESDGQDLALRPEELSRIAFARAERSSLDVPVARRGVIRATKAQRYTSCASGKRRPMKEAGGVHAQVPWSRELFMKGKRADIARSKRAWLSVVLTEPIYRYTRTINEEPAARHAALEVTKRVSRRARTCGEHRYAYLPGLRSKVDDVEPARGKKLWSGHRARETARYRPAGARWSYRLHNRAIAVRLGIA